MVKAVLPMHCFGLPLDIDAVMAVAVDWGLIVIEDAAEALGSWIGDRHCGSIAPLGTLSFNGNKIITTGGGGAVLCQDDLIAARVQHLSTTAKVPHRYLYEHDEVGFNARLPALNAALGVAQMQRLDDFLERKRTLTTRYQAAFADLDGAVLMVPRAGTQANNWLVAIRIKGDRIGRDRLLEALNDAGIGARPVWGLLPDQPMYRNAPTSPLDAARKAEAQVINLPSSAHLVSS
jgi:perosamine synthetase